MGRRIEYYDDYEYYQDRPEKHHYTKTNLRKIGHTAIMNCHHVWTLARDWQNGWEQWIGCEPDFMPQMYIPAHQALHKDCPPIPLINRDILKIVRNDFTPIGSTLESLDEALQLISHASESYKIHPVDREKAQFSIYALERQIPYLRGNIKNNTGGQ